MTRAALGVGLVILFGACGRTDPGTAQQGVDRSAAVMSNASDSTTFNEVLYSTHSVRVSRIPTCSRQDWPPASMTFLPGFPFFEDHWDVYSYRTRASDGRVVETVTNDVGTATGCFGVVSRTDTMVRVYFQGEIKVGDVNVAAIGFCDGFRNTPVGGYTVYGCNWALSGGGYAGGHMVGTSANADATPVTWPDHFDPDPLGLHETSFGVIRLWK